jgi:hypothetical protein
LNTVWLTSFFQANMNTIFQIRIYISLNNLK